MVVEKVEKVQMRATRMVNQLKLNRQMDVEKVERVQMRATRMVKQLQTTYMKIVRKFLICLHSKYRRLRGDLTQVYNIKSGVHDSYSSLQFTRSNVSITRGNQFKM